MPNGFAVLASAKALLFAGLGVLVTTFLAVWGWSLRRPPAEPILARDGRHWLIGFAFI